MLLDSAYTPLLCWTFCFLDLTFSILFSMEYSLLWWGIRGRRTSWDHAFEKASLFYPHTQRELGWRWDSSAEPFFGGILEEWLRFLDSNVAIDKSKSVLPAAPLWMACFLSLDLGSSTFVSSVTGNLQWCGLGWVLSLVHSAMSSLTWQSPSHR